MPSPFLGCNVVKRSLILKAQADLEAFYNKYLVLKANWAKESKAIFGKGVKESYRTARVRVE